MWRYRNRRHLFIFPIRQKDIRRIASMLGVANVLEGSVRKSGNRIRISAQLINAADGYHLWSERYDRDMTDVFAIQDAIDQYHNALELDDHFVPAYFMSGFTYIQTGKFADAIRAIETGIQFTGGMPIDLGILGLAYSMAGRVDEAQILLNQLQELAQKTYVPPFSFAMIYFGLGDIDKSFDWLEKAIDEGDSSHVFHQISYFGALRLHPRYRALLRKMNLEC